MWTPLDVFNLIYLRVNLKKKPQTSSERASRPCVHDIKSSLSRCFPFYLWFSSVFALFFCCSASFFFFLFKGMCSPCTMCSFATGPKNILPTPAVLLPAYPHVVKHVCGDTRSPSLSRKLHRWHKHFPDTSSSPEEGWADPPFSVKRI